jgi:hypothetical protein
LFGGTEFLGSIHIENQGKALTGQNCQETTAVLATNYPSQVNVLREVRGLCRSEPLNAGND